MFFFVVEIGLEWISICSTRQGNQCHESISGIYQQVGLAAAACCLGLGGVHVDSRGRATTLPKTNSELTKEITPENRAVWSKIGSRLIVVSLCHDLAILLLVSGRVC